MNCWLLLLVFVSGVGLNESIRRQREREREIIYLRVITQRLHLLLRFVPRQLGCVFYLLELLSELKTRDTERERDVEKAAMIHDNTS